MATELYQQVIAFDHGDSERNALVHLVWDGHPWMVDVHTGQSGGEQDRAMRLWCVNEFGPEAWPIHGIAGEWHRGNATINGWTWFGFRTEKQMLRFIERWPSPDKDEVSA